MCELINATLLSLAVTWINCLMPCNWFLVSSDDNTGGIFDQLNWQTRYLQCNVAPSRNFSCIINVFKRGPPSMFVQLPKCRGARCLVWTDPATPAGSWPDIGPLQQLLTALWSTRGTQCAVDTGSVLIGRWATRCSPPVNPRLRWPESVSRLSRRPSPRAAA